jgi:NAD(P)H-nitrite reductase large subunit
MGSSASHPSIDGLDRPGSFVLREAGDAMRLRAYVQQHGCRNAVVAGGGLLGLEAAYSLHLLGLQVTVLERGKRLLSRQIDPRCSELVEHHFAKAGIEVRKRAETSYVVGSPAISGVVLKDRQHLPCEVFLAATGIRPNVELDRDAKSPSGVECWSTTGCGPGCAGCTRQVTSPNTTARCWGCGRSLSNRPRPLP